MGLYRRKQDGTLNWWASYTIGGKRIRESTGTPDKEEAGKFLAKRLLGKTVPNKASIGALLDALITDYEVNGKDAAWCRTYVETHIRPYFGGFKAERLDKATINLFIKQKLDADYSNATINRCIALLHRSFTLAECPFPRIEKLAENNVRTGFVENDKFWYFYQRLPQHLKALSLFAYETGCRRSEITSIKWSQLDLQFGFVRLLPGETKNKEGRVIPLSPMTVFLISKLPHVSEYVFTYRNKRLRNFKTGWAAACKAAGKRYENFLFHDLRRSAVRNMVRGGTPERVAMAVSGHKTRSVFDRYNIVDEKDLQTAMKNMDALRLRDLIYDPKKSPEIEQFFQQYSDISSVLVYGLVFWIAGMFFCIFAIASAEVQSKIAIFLYRKLRMKRVANWLYNRALTIR